MTSRKITIDVDPTVAKFLLASIQNGCGIMAQRVGRPGDGFDKEQERVMKDLYDAGDAIEQNDTGRLQIARILVTLGVAAQ